MHRTHRFQARTSLLPVRALAAPGAALAYDEKDAIRDCETRLRSEYKLSDLRDTTAERLNDTALHFKRVQHDRDFATASSRCRRLRQRQRSQLGKVAEFSA